MSKTPAFQFYPADWLKDPAVQAASSATRGAWINLLCRMWESEIRGLIIGTSDQIRKLAGCEKDEWETILNELKELNIAIVQDCPENVRKMSIINRRMQKDEITRRKWAEDKNIWRAKKMSEACPKDVHQMSVTSSSSSSSSTSKQVLKSVGRASAPRLTDQEFIESLKSNQAYGHIDLDVELGKMDAWLSTHPGRHKTRRFVVNWLNKIEPPLEVKNGNKNTGRGNGSVVERWAKKNGIDIWQDDGEGAENSGISFPLLEG